MQTKKSIKRENSKKEKLKIKAHSGITLIALVITIIVLLILAGVALATLTGDSGILNNAENAKNQTKLANAKEQVALAVQAARIEGVGTVTRDKLQAELDSVVGTGKYELSAGEESWTVKVGDYEVTVSKNGNVIKALPSAEGTTPWLPKGFSQVEGTTLDNGLTITNATKLQNYVWIEVPTTIEQSITLSDGTTKTVKLANAANYEEISLILEAYAGDYTKGSSSQNYSSWKDEWYDSNGKNSSTSTNLEDSAGCGMTYSEYQTTYSKMLNSIKKYGGFWLAQYEAGIAYEKDGETATYRTGSSPRITNETSANYAKDQYVYNYVYCSEAQKIANADTTNEYISSLPFGIQWDLVCKFLESKKAKTYEEIATNSTWGNYYNTLYTPSSTAKYSTDYGKSYVTVVKDGVSYSKTGTGAVLLTTGAIEATTESTDASPMNIYDLAGNVCEWTLEHAANTNFPCASRGGGFNLSSYSIPAAYRGNNNTTNGNNYYGFRSALY